jgi:hypothetical protein
MCVCRIYFIQHKLTKNLPPEILQKQTRCKNIFHACAQFPLVHNAKTLTTGTLQHWPLDGCTFEIQGNLTVFSDFWRAERKNEPTTLALNCEQATELPRSSINMKWEKKKFFVLRNHFQYIVACVSGIWKYFR